MGARIEGKNSGEYAPITIQGGGLRPIRYESPIASAQVKSAILLAGLYASGETVITEPYLSRDHTEHLLVRFGVPVRQQGKSISVKGPARLMGQKIRIPGDFSSAAFFIAAASLIPNSSLLLKDVNLNPTRTGLLTVLSQMGARVQVIHKEVTDEPRGDLQIVSSGLKGTTAPAELLPTLIDEVPILMVAASLAEGTTTILGAGELRVKETDRIVSMATGLRAMGGQVITKGNDVVIQGVRKLHAARVHSYGDHRTAMSLAVAGLTTEGETTVEDADCIAKSFPAFARCLESVKRN
jgi:3-phosphoshikimate 1-carboxyvinyltransferase